jgi:hypothetical protein
VSVTQRPRSFSAAWFPRACSQRSRSRCARPAPGRSDVLPARQTSAHHEVKDPEREHCQAQQNYWPHIQPTSDDADAKFGIRPAVATVRRHHRPVVRERVIDFGKVQPRAIQPVVMCRWCGTVVGGTSRALYWATCSGSRKVTLMILSPHLYSSFIRPPTTLARGVKNCQTSRARRSGPGGPGETERVHRL